MTPRPLRILIVDDNEMNRDMLARRLERKGYAVHVAEGAKFLTERIQAEPTDLVLLDVEMPEVSGLEALQRLRARYSPSELPVIMVTAKDQSEDIVKALDLGANDYLTKPIDFPVALARINTQMLRMKAEEALRESEERYALAAQGSNDGLWDWNVRDNIIYFSSRWKSMLGFQEPEIGGDPGEWLERIHVGDRSRVKDEIAAHKSGLTDHFESEYRVQHKDGTFRWMLCRGLAVYSPSGQATRMAGSQTDITEGKVADALTGLPNRLLFLDRLERLIAHTKRHKDYLFAVLFLDLDGFKMINDSLGHGIGDQLLVGVANRLEKCLRITDTVTRIEKLFTIARLGGDEFTILLDQVKDPSDATLVADRLMTALAAPFLLEGRKIFTSISVGIALSNIGYDKAEDLLRDADTAMYRAKATGKGRYEVFDLNMRASVIARLQLETDLRTAVEREEFRNYYQPIVSLGTGPYHGIRGPVALAAPHSRTAATHGIHSGGGRNRHDSRTRLVEPAKGLPPDRRVEPPPERRSSSGNERQPVCQTVFATEFGGRHWQAARRSGPRSQHLETGNYRKLGYGRSRGGGRNADANQEIGRPAFHR